MRKSAFFCIFAVIICYNQLMDYSDFQEPTYDYTLADDRIADEVIAVAAARAILNTEGVCDLSGGIGDSISKTILRKETLSKGIKTDQSDEGIRLDVYIVVYYGERIPDIAWNIQRNVKDKIQEMTERKVLAVNIHVQGVQEKKAKK